MPSNEGQGMSSAGIRNQIILGVILGFLVLIVQLSAIGRPYLGHFSSYQTVMMSISKNMLTENFSELLLPKTDLLISGKKSLHLTQYPFPSLFAALAMKFVGGTWEFWGRFQAILFNLISILVLGLIARNLFRDGRMAWLSTIIYALSPFTLIYGQTFMSESMGVCFLLLSLYLVLRGKEGWLPFWQFILSALCLSISLIERIHYLFFFPVILYILFFVRKQNLFQLAFYIFITLFLPVAWYVFTYFAGLNADNVLTTIFLQFGFWKTADNSFLTQLDYYRRIFDIFSQSMLTPLFFPFLALGVLFIPKFTREFWVITLGISCGSLILFLSPQKIMEQDFYLNGLFPFVVLLTACGLKPLFEACPVLLSKKCIAFVVALYFLVSARYFLHPIFKYPLEEERIIPIASFVQSVSVPGDRLIVAGYSTADMIYYGDRPAWSLELSQLGQGMPLFASHPRFTKLSQKKIDELVQAAKDPVTWFEYYRNAGAEYFLAHHKKDLETYPELIAYLQKNHKQLSSDSDDFYFFKI